MTSRRQRVIDANKTLREIVQASWSGCPDEIPALWQQIPPDLRVGVREVLVDAVRVIDDTDTGRGA